MSSHVEASGSAIAHEVEPDGTRRSLLAVLPLTTAWAGAAGVVVVPTAFVLVGAVVGRSASGLSFLLVMAPAMIGGAAAAFVFGLAAGALAGLPDWWLRRRRSAVLGSVAAVVVLTVVVAGATCVAGLLVPYLLPWDVGAQVSVVGAATAVSTVVVIAVHRRRERRRGQQERGRTPAGPRT